MVINENCKDKLDRDEYLKLIKKTLVAWFIYGFLSSLIWYPIIINFTTTKTIELSARGGLIAVLTYEIVFRNKGKKFKLTEENYRATFLIAATEAFLFGAYVFSLIIYCFYHFSRS